MKLHKLKPNVLKTELEAILFLEGIKIYQPQIVSLGNGYMSIRVTGFPRGMFSSTYKLFRDEMTGGFSAFLRVIHIRWNGSSVYLRNNKKQFVNILSINFMTPPIGEFIDETRKPGFYDKFDKTSYQTLTIELEEDVHYRQALQIIRSAISNLTTT